MRSTRVSSDLAVRARLCVWRRIDVGERLEPDDLATPGASRAWPGAASSSLPCDEVLRVRAVVLDELAVVEVQDARDRLVEQREVVADDEQRAAERAQERHQPFLGVDVEVVRRLVEQQEVVAGEQDARELDPPAFTTRERADREVEAIGGEPESGRDAPHLRLRPRSRPRSRTRPPRWRTRATLRGDGSASTAACSSATSAAAASRPRPESTCDERGAVAPLAPCAAGPGRGSRAPSGGTRSRRPARDSPAMTFSSEVLPAPLRPTSPTLSPACSENEAPVVVNRPPTSTLRSRTWSTRHCRARRLRSQDQFFSTATRERRRPSALAVPTATTPSSQSASNPVISPPTACQTTTVGDLGAHDRRRSASPKRADACACVHATQPPRAHRVRDEQRDTDPEDRRERFVDAARVVEHVQRTIGAHRVRT